MILMVTLIMMMDTQGEQLNRVEANLDTINNEVIIIIMIMNQYGWLWMTMDDNHNDMMMMTILLR